MNYILKVKVYIFNLPACVYSRFINTNIEKCYQMI